MRKMIYKFETYVLKKEVESLLLGLYDISRNNVSEEDQESALHSIEVILNEALKDLDEMNNHLALEGKK